MKKIWVEISSKFAAVCEDNDEYRKFLEKKEKMYSLLDFNDVYAYSDEFYISELDDYNLEFNQRKYEEHKYIAENLDKLNKEIEKKIEKLKRSRFAFNKAQRIAELEERLKYNNESAEMYNFSQESIRVKEKYLNRKDELEKMFEDEYKEILFKYASEIVKSYVEAYPVIVCKEHKTINGCLTQNQGDMLNNVFNKMREELLKKLNVQTATVSKR